MKIKVWIPYIVTVNKTEVRQAMKRVREALDWPKSGPVHMEDVMHELIDGCVVDLPGDYEGLGMKFEPEWQEPFMENEL